MYLVYGLKALKKLRLWQPNTEKHHQLELSESHFCMKQVVRETPRDSVSFIQSIRNRDFGDKPSSNNFSKCYLNIAVSISDFSLAKNRRREWLSRVSMRYRKTVRE